MLLNQHFLSNDNIPHLDKIRLYDNELFVRNTLQVKKFLWGTYFSDNDKITLFEKQYDDLYNRVLHLANLLEIFQFSTNAELWNFINVLPPTIKNIIGLVELHDNVANETNKYV